jgi:hypothetical protein
MLKKPREKKISSRSWQLIIPLDFPYGEIAAKIKLVAKNYYFIRHDKDIDDFGVPKKEHYHFLFTFSNARDLSTVKNYFAEFVKEDGEPWLLDNSFEKIVSIVGAKKYLCHFEHPSKAQYDYTDVETNDLLFGDLFSIPVTKNEMFDDIKKTFLEVNKVNSLDDFIDRFKRLAPTMNAYQMHSIIRSSISFYESRNALVKGDGFTPVEPPYDYRECEANKSDLGNLPF